MTSPTRRLYEQVLVVRSQAGDEAAFEELVAEYDTRLRYYLRKLLNDSEAAEDALQDVWLDVLRNFGRLRDPASFAAWIYRIARDHAMRRLRRQPPLSLTPEEADAIADVSEDSAFTAQEADAVHIALDELRPEHREVLLLRFVAQMTYEDIAGVVGCGVGTVRSRIHYAKRALRQIIERRQST